MQHTVIRMLKPEISNLKYPDQDSYAFNKSKGWIWLQKLCFKILDKIGAHKLISEKVVVYTPTQSQNFHDLLNTEFKLEQLYHYRGEYVLFMGEEEYKHFFQENYAKENHPVPFHFNQDIKVRWGLDLFGCRDQFFSMEIVVLPWMSGYLIAPKKFIEVNK